MTKKERILSYKKYILLGILVILLLFILLFFIGREDINKSINIGSDTNENVEVLKVTYKNGKDIIINNFKHSFEAEKEIVIENTSKKYITYNLDWESVKNTLKNQSDFVYTIESLGHNAGSLGNSQVPVASSKIFSSVMLSPEKEHTYKIKFKYDSSFANRKGYFKGSIVVNKVSDK